MASVEAERGPLTVRIDLSESEAEELAGILGECYGGPVDELYTRLLTILGGGLATSTAYGRGVRAVQGGQSV